MGLFDLFNYPLTALSYFGYIALFIVLVGGFYGILHKIPAYRTFLDKIVAVFKGKEMISSKKGNLLESGINEILLSVDAFHQETIPLDVVKSFAEADAKSIKIR